MNYTLPLEQLQHNVAQHPDRAYLHQPDKRQWHSLTWGEVDQQARRIASGLLAHGLQAGDRVAILAKNSAEWFISDFAIMMAGMISVPVYATAGVNTIEYILEHSDAKLIFLGKLDDSSATEEVLTRIDIPAVVYPYDTAPKVERAQPWQSWLQQYPALEDLYCANADDTISIVYTSGSTGTPKGAVLSHLNFASSSYETAQVMPDIDDHRFMSYLPLAHITERCVVEYMSLYKPSEIFFVESLETFLDDVKHTQPTVFLSVPRLWTKFQSGVLAKLPDEKLQRLLGIPLIGRLVARKVRKGLGLDKALLCASGSAPIPPETLLWYHRLGLNICEGWGMTETSALSCGNLPFDPERVGTIGLPRPCVEMMLSDQSEILIRGQAVFKEYYRSPDASADAFSGDWFHTGDRAIVTGDGAWKIVGRLKEQFKTSKGKFVTPVPIESLLVGNSLLEQACVMGLGRKQPVAAVVLAEGCQLEQESLRAELQALLDSVNAQLEGHERLDHLIVSSDFWTIDNGLLTPTLKIKRDRITELFEHYIHRTLPDSVVWQSEL